MNLLFILLGAAPPSSEELGPDPHEPYHVVFNYQVAASERQTYVFASELEDYTDKIRALEPDSDHPPQPEFPYIHFLEEAILPGFGASTQFPSAKTGARLLVPNIHKIAHPDRRGKLPKAFQMRLGYSGTGVFPESMVFKYNLNGSGTKYVALRGLPDPATDKLLLRLEYCLDGYTVTASADYATGWNLAGSESDDLRFVIRDSKLQLYIGQPGVLRLELELPQPLQIQEAADLEIMNPINSLAPDVDAINVSDLLIYDAYL